jgi:Tfp pilus assembly protein PilW
MIRQRHPRLRISGERSSRLLGAKPAHQIHSGLAGYSLLTRPLGTPEPERGVTLTELAIVLVLAGLVMLGISAFYFNSQEVWMQGSAQAIAQREASFAIERVRDVAHAASSALADSSGGDPDHIRLVLTDADLTQHVFWCDDVSKQLHESVTPDGGPQTDLGPIASSRVARFLASTSPEMVTNLSVELISAEGQTVSVSSAAALLNKTP